MDRWEFLKWRRTLGFTQEEAGEELGFGRGTVGNWESGTTSIPRSVELACCEITRRWKQRFDFGPVNLVYINGKAASQEPYLRCELFSNNEVAIRRALNLSADVINAMILEDGGGVVWPASELLRELERRSEQALPPESLHERGDDSKKEQSTPPAYKLK